MADFDYVVYSRKSDNTLSELHRGTVKDSIDVFVEKKDVTLYTVTVSKSGSTITAKDTTGKVLASGTDAATVIQSGVNAVKTKGVGAVHINAGTYLLTKGIALAGANNICFEGESKETTHLKCSVAGQKILTKSGTTTKQVQIRNIDIDGANISDKLIDFNNIADLVMYGVTLQRHNENSGPGVYIENLDGGLVENCLIADPAGVGDAFGIGGYRLVFQKNEMTRKNAPGGGFTSGGLVDSKILNNNFHDMKTYSATSLENFHLRSGNHSFDNVEIAYNTYRNLENVGGSNAISSLGHADPGLAPKGTSNKINVHHNTLENVSGGIRLNCTDKINVMTFNSTIADNTLTDTAGIMLGPLKTCTVARNTVNRTKGYRGYGVYLYKGSDDVKLDGNTLTNLAKQPPIYFTGSTNIYVNGTKAA